MNNWAMAKVRDVFIDVLISCADGEFKASVAAGKGVSEGRVEEGGGVRGCEASMHSVDE